MSSRLFEPTRDEKLAAIERELGFRRRVYPRMVADRKMSPTKAQSEIEIFEAIANDYRGKP